MIGHEIAMRLRTMGTAHESTATDTAWRNGTIGGSEKQPALTKQLALAAFGVGAQLGILLPCSRTHETEADRLGMIFIYGRA